MSALREHIAAALAGVAPEADLSAIDPGWSMREHLDLDSMDFLHFLAALHARLGVDIPEADYPKVATLDALEQYLRAHLPP